jgi:hypothetical protein
MSGVRTFKALDYDMRLYGFWPADLVIVCFVFIVVHGILNSLVADVVTVGPALLGAWRARRRSPRYGTTLLSFVLTPDRYAVGLAPEEYTQ